MTHMMSMACSPFARMVLVIAVALTVATFAGVMTPWLLLLLTLGLSIGDAFESPTWRAIFPELVDKEELPAALALNGIEFNLARAVGPGLGGFIVASAGVGAAFAFNALSFFGVIAVIKRWKRPVRKSTLPAETFRGATSAAIRYVRYSPGYSQTAASVGSSYIFHEFLLGAPADRSEGTQ